MGKSIGAREIAARHGISFSRVHALHRDRASSGFPRGRKQGRRLEWDETEVDEWAADRKPPRYGQWAERAADLTARAPQELLTAPEAARVLKFENTSVIHHYLHDVPGYFPEPDIRGPVPQPGRGRPPEMQWYVATLLTWVHKRMENNEPLPSTAASRQESDLQPVSAEGAPEELLAAPQAAYLLGYKSTRSFFSALAQGRLPLLSEGDVRRPGVRGAPRRLWKRATVLRQAAERPSRGHRSGKDTSTKGT